jgi:two-component system chemotaxis response regulator CheB
MTARVLVVDDSVVVRRAVANVLAEDDGIGMVATASDGRLGLRRIAELAPDVVTLDVEMPGLSGLETLAEIRREWPRLPVIMYSTLTERGASVTLDALVLGAVDYATKPTGAPTRDEAAQQIRDTLLPLVRLWGTRRVGERPGQRDLDAVPALPTAPRPVVPSGGGFGRVELLTIGVSTGGPDALATLLPLLPSDLRVPVLIVQHMPPLFTGMLAERLDRHSALSVSEARDGERAEAGHVYIAPGGRHLEVTDGLRLVLSDTEPENFCRPAVDVLFRSAAAVAGRGLLAAVLTGMGHDGLRGAEQVCAAGGQVVVQDEASSVVWGMPGYVARAGLATHVLDLPGIAAHVTRRTQGPVRPAPRLLGTTVSA